MAVRVTAAAVDVPRRGEATDDAGPPQFFHAPGCQRYNCRNCTVPFATVAQAKAAGFRPHEECVK